MKKKIIKSNENEKTDSKIRRVKLKNMFIEVELVSSYDSETMPELVGNAVELIKIHSPQPTIKDIPYIK